MKPSHLVSLLCTLEVFQVCTGSSDIIQITTGLKTIVEIERVSPDEDGNDVKYIPVPLKSVDIKSRLINFVAEVNIVQTYENVEQNPIECVYMFPIEEGAAVINFKAELEGRTLKSQVKPKDEAKKQYDDAVSAGKTGFLVETVKPDILQIKVGHLSPGANCTISLTYIMETALDEGNVRLTIPTTIAPKYVPFTDNTPEAERIKSIKHDFSSPAPMTFSVEALMKTKIEEVTSPSHNITTGDIEDNIIGKNGLYTAKRELTTSTTDLDRDIIILVNCESADTSMVLREKSGDSNILMVSMVPSLPVDINKKLDIVFLVDCSGSMMGSSIKLARDALKILMHSLPSYVHFNIVRFGSTFKPLFTKSRPYNDDNLSRANELIESMEADLLGTEILPPLKKILEEETDFPRRVFVLTDGSVSNQREILKLTKKHSTDKKVFSLGIGSSADRNLVKGLARAGDGTFEFTVQGEMIAPKVIKQLKHCLQPNLNNIAIDWGSNMDDNDISQAPSTIPQLYDGHRIQIFKVLEEGVQVPNVIKITANKHFEKDAYEEEIPVEESILEGDLLHKMFARKKIQELEENKHSKKKVTDLAVKYQVMSKYTSIIAVDTEENEFSLMMQSRTIPNQSPYGFPRSRSKLPYYYDTSDDSYEDSYDSGHSFIASNSGSSIASNSVSSNSNYDYDDYDSLSLGHAASNSINRMVYIPHNSRSRSRSRNKQHWSGRRGSSSNSRSSYGPFGSGRKGSSRSRSGTGSSSNPPQSKVDQVVDLISLQTTEGLFSNSKKIYEILNIQEADANIISKDIDENIFNTLLVLTALEERFKDLHSSWDLVGRKGKEYLKKQNVPSLLRQKIVALLATNVGRN